MSETIETFGTGSSVMGDRSVPTTRAAAAAAAPVGGGGTFGVTSIVGAAASPCAATQSWANKRTLPVNGTITKITMYLDNPGASTQFIIGALWADSAGSPGALLAEHAGLTVPAGTAAGWVDLVFSVPYVAVAADYWLGLGCGGTTNMVRKYATTGASGVMKYRAVASPQNPFGAASNWTDDVAIYATYT